MIGLLCFVLAVLASPFKSKMRLEAENAVRRHQLIVLRRLAENYSLQADAMQPGPERDALITKARQYQSSAKMENWIASKELQRPTD
jgi:hypothetical protein